VTYTKIKAAQLSEDNLDNAKMAWGAWLGFYNGYEQTLLSLFLFLFIFLFLFFFFFY
jgi:hypothetical protein